MVIKMKRSKILTFFLFTIIFAPFLNIGLGFFGDMLSFVCILFILVYMIKSLQSGRIQISKGVLNLIGILVISFIYTLFTSLLTIYEIKDFTAVLRPIRAIIVFLGVYIFVGYYIDYYGEQFLERIMNDIYLAIGIHAAIMIIELIIPELRNFIYHYTFADRVDEYNQQFRMAGLAMGGGSQLSVFQSLGAIIFPFVFKVSNKLKTKVIHIIIILMIFASVILSGRSGVYIILIFLPLGYFLNRKIIRIKVNIPKKSQLIYIILILCMVSALLMNNNDVKLLEVTTNGHIAMSYKIAKYRAFETFTGIFKTGKLNDRTINILISQHMKFPDSVPILLFGNPSLLDVGQRGVDSDIGYIRFLFGYGVIGSFILYLFYIFSLIYAYRFRKINSLFSSLTIIMLIIILIFQAKEVFVFARMGFSITSLLTVSMFYYNSILKKENNIGVKTTEREEGYNEIPCNDNNIHTKGNSKN